MIYLSQHFDKIIALFLLISMSLAIRILLQVLGQRWVTTTAHTGTLVLLPLLTYIITNVIAGNIALSLGMVGALSIVRFRHPVRSPLELSVYFGAITMGIAASVSLMWLVFLGGAVALASTVLLLIHYMSLLLIKKPFFTASFSEGSSLSTLEITSSISIDWLEKSRLLTTKRYTLENIHYTLVSRNFDDLLVMQKDFIDNDDIQSYQLNR